MDGIPNPSSARQLPVVGQPPAERADAARNRQKILAAAAHILNTRGVGCLSLDEVAREAGVGVGTVYRRFGDRPTLIAALFDEGERKFQAAFIAGPPPLGPGAPAVDRIRAFLHALLDRQEEHWELMLLADRGGDPSKRFDAPPIRAQRLHLLALLAEASPAADREYIAEALLAMLAPVLLNYQIRERGMTPARIKAGLDRFLRGIP